MNEHNLTMLNKEQICVQ